MKDMESLAAALEMLSTRAAEYKAFERTLSQLTQALVDLLDKLNQPAAPQQDIAAIVTAAVVAAIKGMPAPMVSVAAPAKAEWSEIEVAAPVDSMGRPTGTMKLRKVK